MFWQKHFEIKVSCYVICWRSTLTVKQPISKMFEFCLLCKTYINHCSVRKTHSLPPMWTVLQGRIQDFRKGGGHHWKCKWIERSERSERSVITAWGPGARLRAPGGVEGQSPGGSPEGRAPGSFRVFLHFNILKRAYFGNFFITLSCPFSNNYSDIKANLKSFSSVNYLRAYIC